MQSIINKLYKLRVIQEVTVYQQPSQLPYSTLDLQILFFLIFFLKSQFFRSAGNVFQQIKKVWPNVTKILEYGFTITKCITWLTEAKILPSPRHIITTFASLTVFLTPVDEYFLHICPSVQPLVQALALPRCFSELYGVEINLVLGSGPQLPHNCL